LKQEAKDKEAGNAVWISGRDNWNRDVEGESRWNPMLQEQMSGVDCR